MTLEEALVEHCSPTLAGVKAGNMFRYVAHRSENIRTLIRDCEKEMSKDIKISILKYCMKTSSYLLYVYREKQLEEIFSDTDICNFMDKYSYCSCHTHRCYISRLTERMLCEDDFPHEVGIFLGYPLCDVIGFIENRGKNYTCCGLWKSYCNPNEAELRFERIRICSRIYKKMFRQGVRLKELTV